ncbi:hypothetical protein AB4254_08130 [Vibrio breoganii]
MYQLPTTIQKAFESIKSDTSPDNILAAQTLVFKEMKAQRKEIEELKKELLLRERAINITI